MLYESASRASAVLALNVEDLDLPNKQVKITAKGGDVIWITWGTGTVHLLPRLIAGRERGPLFLSEHRPGAHRRATTDPDGICPETGRARLGYDRARILLAHYGDGLRLHQLRHSSVISPAWNPVRHVGYGADGPRASRVFGSCRYRWLRSPLPSGGGIRCEQMSLAGTDVYYFHHSSWWHHLVW
jgi:integrase